MWPKKAIERTFWIYSASPDLLIFQDPKIRPQIGSKFTNRVYEEFRTLEQILKNFLSFQIHIYNMILSVKSLRKISVKCHRVMKMIENIINHTGPGY